MQYIIEFGINKDYQLISVCWMKYFGNTPMKLFKHYAETLRMAGLHFGDMDYVALRKDDANKSLIAIKIIKNED